MFEKGISWNHTSKVFQLINQNIYGFLFWGLQRNSFSLHLVIFENGSMRLCSISFPTYQPKYLWVFIFRVAEKGYNKPEYYEIFLIIRTRNPDNPDLRSSWVLPYIYGGGSVTRNEWGIEVLPYKGFSWNHTSKCFPTYQPKYLWVFIFGVAEKRFPLNEGS
jgi:hypothetical protein